MQSNLFLFGWIDVSFFLFPIIESISYGSEIGKKISIFFFFHEKKNKGIIQL